MTTELLQEIESGSKSGQIKTQIISYYIEHGSSTITELSKFLNLSVPTVTKFISELTDHGCVTDYGKLETTGGRYPILYGMHPEAGYFIGVDVKHTSINIGMIDFVGNIITTEYDIPYKFINEQSAIDELCELIRTFIAGHAEHRNKILNININLPGRINPITGFSYTFWNFDNEISLAEQFGKALNLPVTVDNDTRGMAYGEYTQGCASGRNLRHVLYLNMSWGVGLGIILDNKIYIGKSGFSGEFGHISVWDNEILCQCGKKGCFETECSGKAMHRIIIERIRNGENSILSERVLRGEEISLDDIIDASNREDVLCLEVLSDMGAKIGRQVASLINVFNPEMVIVGGSLSLTGNYLTQAIQTLVCTYSLKLVNRDTVITTATLGEKAGVIGACMLARSRRFAERT